MFNQMVRSIVIVALVAMILPVSVLAVTSSEIEAELMCDCGCGDMLINCTCERSEEMRAIITGMINEGQSKTQILAAFVSQFGEVILSSPPRKGFNLVAYSVPLAGLLVGSVVAVSLARRWRSSKREDDDEEPETKDVITEELEEKIRGEMENLED